MIQALPAEIDLARGCMEYVQKISAASVSGDTKKPVNYIAIYFFAIRDQGLVTIPLKNSNLYVFCVISDLYLCTVQVTRMNCYDTDSYSIIRKHGKDAGTHQET